MSHINPLLRPLAWLREFFKPKMALEVELAIEQLQWCPASFRMDINRDLASGQIVVQIKSIETLWTFPGDEPMTVCICLSATECWLHLSDDTALKVNRHDQIRLMEAVNVWIMEHA